MQIHTCPNFISMFDESTGLYMRTGILENGKDTGVDPFMAPFPELLDVGIMGHCIHGSTGLCLKAGVECYQDGLHAASPNMKLEDFQRIAKECQGKCYQFALGGCGDPDQHEHFEEILKICRNNNIVPNFTTSGLGLNEETAMLCKEYCGAVAISWYRSPYTLKAVNLLLHAGVKTNIHYVLSRTTIKEAITRLKADLTENSEEAGFPKGINAVVFLLHKPVGLGTRENMLEVNDPDLAEFLSLALDTGLPYKIGFDSCSVPALIQNPENLAAESVDTCEGARWSAYITPDMKLLPCSFDNQKQIWAYDLNQGTIEDGWNSEPFEDFRSHFRKSCPGCKNRGACMGGCPIVPEIVLCPREERLVPRMQQEGRK